MRKVQQDAGAALSGLLHDDMTIVAGGLGLCGIPENLIDAIPEPDCPFHASAMMMW
jgi:3-oxoacid CoA-transferase subunit A